MNQNSTHAKDVCQLFDLVVATISGPMNQRLSESGQPSGSSFVAVDQFASDILHIATVVHASTGGMTASQYAFFGALYDHVAKRGTSATADEFHCWCANLAVSNQLYCEPPTTSLNLLRGYDAVYGTMVARMYKELMMKFVIVVLTQVVTPGTRESALVQEFDNFWTEVVMATRSPARCIQPESISLIADLNKAVSDFVGPAGEVIRSVPQLSQMDGLSDTEGFVRKTFTNYCAQAVLVDSVVDERELELFHDLAPTLMYFGSNGSLQSLRQMFLGASKNIEPGEMPLLVRILDIYDNSMKTNYGGMARSLYMKLARTAFKADLNVCQVELEWLEQFKKTLYPLAAAS